MDDQRSRFRPDPAKRIVLQARDIDIVTVLFACRCMTTSMVRETFFADLSASRCRRRLRHLYDWGLVDRHFMPTAPYGSEAVYTVGKAGLPYALAWYADLGVSIGADDARSQTRLPALSLLNHSINVAGMFLASRRHLASPAQIRMDRWLFERLVDARFEVRESATGGGRPRPWRTVAFKPDGAVQLSGGPGRIRTLFLEADCGTETSRQMTVKFDAHRQFLASGQFSALYGEETFLTVVATTGAADGRARNLATIAERVGADFVLTTTMRDFVAAGPLACEYLRPCGSRTTLRDALGPETGRGTKP